MKNLFNPIKINSLEIRNRIAMPAMHLGYCREGFVTDEMVDFYVERARGGAGLIIVGGCPIDEHGMGNMSQVNHDKYIEGLARLAGAVKEQGAAISAQLFQAGRYAHSFLMGLEPIAPSPVPSKLTRQKPREMTEEDIYKTIEDFTSAAFRVKQAGFDMVEVIASAGYLISQFLSPVTNLRQDGFGGDMGRRMRFGLEVARSIRKKVGPSFPIMYRVGGNDFISSGNTNDEIKIFCRELEKEGVDALNVTGGWHETTVPQITMAVPKGAFVYLASQIKEAVNIPVMACNRINSPELAEEIVSEGLADMVGIARGFIADPELANKAREGRPEEVRRCIGCNQGCLDSVFTLRKVVCLVNARAGREGETKLAPAPFKKKVLVIGAGPAGLEAARVAALRGHSVTVWERESCPGGQLNIAAVPPGRGDFAEVVSFLSRELSRLGVEVLYNQEANLENTLAFGADALVVATGARPIVPRIPGVEGKNVVQAWDVLAGKCTTGKNVVIVGGGAVGCETALHLAQKGTIDAETFKFLALNRAESWDKLMELATRGTKNVTVLEMQRSVGSDIGPSTRWVVLQEMQRHGVKAITGATVTGITPDGASIRVKDGEDMLKADTVVLAVGSAHESALCEALKEKVKEIYMVGDAVKPRKALDAIYDGFMAGIVL